MVRALGVELVLKIQIIGRSGREVNRKSRDGYAPLRQVLRLKSAHVQLQNDYAKVGEE